MFEMFSDSAENMLSLKMSELQQQQQQQFLPPTPPPPPMSSLIPSPPHSLALVDFTDINGFDFCPFPIDNSSPNQGTLLNERRNSFPCSSPLFNNSFRNDTSPWRNLQHDKSGCSSSDSFAPLTTNTSTPYRGIEANHSTADFQCLLNGFGHNAGLNSSIDTDSTQKAGANYSLPPPIPFPLSAASHQGGRGVLNDSGFSSSFLSSVPGGGGELGASAQWASPPKANISSQNQGRSNLSFPFSESTVGIFSDNNSCNSNNCRSNASAESSPIRFIGGGVDDLGSAIQCSYANPWNFSDVSSSSLLEDQSHDRSNLEITESALVQSLLNMPSLEPAACNNDTVPPEIVANASNKLADPFQFQNEDLMGRTKQQLLNLVDLLKLKFEESIRFNQADRSAQIQGAMIQVQDYIINSFMFETSDNNNVCNAGVITSPGSMAPPLLSSPTENTLDQMVKLHREIAGSRDAPYTWSGQLPLRNHRNATYSCKVFLGGLPWDVNDDILMQIFQPFGIFNIEWPGKDGAPTKPKGFAYAVFENEKQVKLLLENCTHDYNQNCSGNYYYKVSSRKYRGKNVQIIPWALHDTNFNRMADKRIDPHKTIFVGGLHGVITAEGLSNIMQDLFGGVVYAGIDTDRKKYPIGSARVTFSNTRSFMKAVTAGFILVKAARFEKRIQVDPYLEDATCSECKFHQGPYFCRDEACFTYYCRTCFHSKHSHGEYRNHSPMVRTHNRTLQQQQKGNNLSGSQGGSGGGTQNGSGGGNSGCYNHGGHNQQSTRYTFGSRYNNNHHNNNYNGFCNNTRSWGNNGSTPPPFNSANGGGAGSPSIGMNGGNKRYNMNDGGGHMNDGGGHMNDGGGHMNDGGGHMNGGGSGCNNNNNSPGTSHQQLPFTNRAFEQVGSRQQQQQQQMMRW